MIGQISESSGRKNKKITLFIGALTVILIFVGAFILWFKTMINKPNSSIASTKSFVIESGEGAGDISARLKQEKILRNHLAFVIYLNWQKIGDKLQAGQYDIPQNLNIKELASFLTTGKISSSKLTIPEGWTIEKIAERAESQFGIPKSKFLAEAQFANYDIPDYFTGVEKSDSMEGFLYPATYELPKNPTAKDIVSRMFETFKKKYTREIQAQVTAKKMTTFEVVTLASIVEREVSNVNDRKMVAGVFLNRLAIGMPLESCATIQYITGTNKSQFTFAETQTPSSYNTYLHAGLPKGPIGSPSIESINAVISPTESNYLYFLSAKGVTYFSKTLEEHNAKKAQYLQ